jgi:hypothetical protein
MGYGYKPFTAASVLTSADVNNYLMTQSVMYFATTAARDTAITSPVDGMVAYVGSNDSSEGLYTYNGTAWRKGPGWNAPFGYVVHATATSNVAANNAIILSSTASVLNNRRYRITAHVPGFRSSDVTGVAGIAVVVGGTVIAKQNIGCVLVNSANFGGTIVAIYNSTATNSALSVVLWNLPNINNGTHTFEAGSTTPIMIMVEDIGPSGAPA